MIQLQTHPGVSEKSIGRLNYYENYFGLIQYISVFFAVLRKNSDYLLLKKALSWQNVLQVIFFSKSVDIFTFMFWISWRTWKNDSSLNFGSKKCFSKAPKAVQFFLSYWLYFIRKGTTSFRTLRIVILNIRKFRHLVAHSIFGKKIIYIIFSFIWSVLSTLSYWSFNFFEDQLVCYHKKSFLELNSTRNANKQLILKCWCGLWHFAGQYL